MAAARRPGKGERAATRKPAAKSKGAAKPKGAAKTKRTPTSKRSGSRRVAPPLEHRVLLTATLCLLAFGAVMIYSASSPVGALSDGGSGAGEFLRYIVFVALGLGIMYFLERHGLELLTERLVQLLLIGSGALLVLVLVPHFGVQVQGARRWFGAGPIQFQPSEIAKLALILYAAQKLATPHKRSRSWWEVAKPVAWPALIACGLIVVEPDLGTTLVVALTMLSMLLAAGLPAKYLLGIIGAGAVAVMILVLIQPYQRARLTSFLHPCAAVSKASTGYQSLPGPDRARFGRSGRGRPREVRAEGLLPARGADRLHPGGHRRGASASWESSA